MSLATDAGGMPTVSNPGQKFISLVDHIKQGDEAAAGELYEMIWPGLRWMLYRQLGSDVDDKLQDVFLIVLTAIRSGSIRDPQRLVGFVRTVAQRKVCEEISERQMERATKVPLDTPNLVLTGRERLSARIDLRQQIAFVKQVLEELSTRDREVLVRFYLHEESAEEIMSSMGLSETQFRLLKSRAKQRFGDLGRQTMARKQLRARAATASA